MNRADDFLRKSPFGIWIFLCLFLVNLKVGTSSTVHVSKRSLYSEPSKSIPGPEKNYTGLRMRGDSLLLLYYHEQTVAIVETDQSRALYNCELLEVKTKTDKQVALNSLKHVIPSQMRIGFDDMMDLMKECSKLNIPWNFKREHSDEGVVGSRLSEARQFISILSGMFPAVDIKSVCGNGHPSKSVHAQYCFTAGTKWCGPGDQASSYHDLGPEREIDKCCRHHDLCPVKVSALRTQYNLTNYAFYTRSHCKCDETFYDCLKAVDSTVSKTLGRIYFNVTPVVCVDDTPSGQGTQKTRKEFTTLKKRF